MATEHLARVHGTSVMICAPDGIPVDTEGAAAELIGEGLGQRAQVVVIPSERLTDDFFELATGVAGLIVQRFAAYRLRLAVVGDISHRGGDAGSLRSWVAESNRGSQLWFCCTFDEFRLRLRP